MRGSPLAHPMFYNLQGVQGCGYPRGWLVVVSFKMQLLRIGTFMAYLWVNIDRRSRVKERELQCIKMWSMSSMNHVRTKRELAIALSITD